MFDVGFAEIFLLSVIGLLVLGPERLPAVARTLGGFMRKARASWYQLKRSIETELAAADVSEPLKAAQREMQEVSREISSLAKEPVLPGEAQPPDTEAAETDEDGTDDVTPADEKGAAREP